MLILAKYKMVVGRLYGKLKGGKDVRIIGDRIWQWEFDETSLGS
jgi:hypothetical protein